MKYAHSDITDLLFSSSVTANSYKGEQTSCEICSYNCTCHGSVPSVL